MVPTRSSTFRNSDQSIASSLKPQISCGTHVSLCERRARANWPCPAHRSSTRLAHIATLTGSLPKEISQSFGRPAGCQPLRVQDPPYRKLPQHFRLLDIQQIPVPRDTHPDQHGFQLANGCPPGVRGLSELVPWRNLGEQRQLGVTPPPDDSLIEVIDLVSGQAFLAEGRFLGLADIPGHGATGSPDGKDVAAASVRQARNFLLD